MASIFDGLTSKSIQGQNPPDEDVVAWIHAKVGTDAADDLHHRLGYGRGDAARGDHTHDGANSKGLWDPSAIPANVSVVDANSTAINAILALLRQKSASA